MPHEETQMVTRDRPLKEVGMSWRDLKLLVALTGAHMNDGESSRAELCPSCFGGSSGERAFSIMRSGNTIFFKCFRASCAIRGSTDVYGTLGDTKIELVPKAVDRRRFFTGKLIPLQPDHHKLLGSKYGIWAEEFHDARVLFDPQEGRFSFPVLSPSGLVRGMSLRSFDPHKLKWDHYREDWLNPWMAWYERPYVSKSKPLIIVEDQISALKVSRSYLAVAILGTHLNLEMVQEIGMIADQRQVLLALDKDATAKAVEFVDQFKFFTNGRFAAMALDKDIKFMSTPEVLSLVGAHTNG